MRLLFVHLAEKIKIDNEGNVYTDGAYSMKIWERYLAISNSLTIITRRDRNSYTKSEAVKRFNWVDTNQISCIQVNDIYSSLRSFFDIKLRKERKAIIKKQIKVADALIVRLPGAGWIIKFAKTIKKPCLVEVVGCPFDALWNHSWKGRILAIPSSLKLKYTMRKATHSIYVTNKFLQRRYPTKGLQIGCSDVQISIADQNNKLDVKEIINERKKLVIGTAGAVNLRYKGQQYVIKALAQLDKENRKNYLYQIAGNGDNSYLKSLVEKYDLHETVEFMGSISHDNMNKWYNGLDIYIQPSKTEGMPRALIEAMSVGVPCIGSRVGGIPELLDNDSLFRKGNVKEIERILLRFTDAEVRREKAEICYKKSLEYDTEILTKKRQEFMKKALLERNTKEI